jgi:hypothetical protein
MTPNEICAVVLSVWLTRLTVKKEKCWMLFSWWKIYRPYYSYYTFVCPSACVYMSFASVCPCATCNRCPPLSLSPSRFGNPLALSTSYIDGVSSLAWIISDAPFDYLRKDMAAKRRTRTCISQPLRHGPAVTNCKVPLPIHPWNVLPVMNNSNPKRGFLFSQKTKRESRQQASQFVK